MNRKILTLLLIPLLADVSAQVSITDPQESIYKNLLLHDIGLNLDRKFKDLDSTILTLDLRTGILDKAITEAKDVSAEAIRLRERLLYIEQKQSALEDAETSIYQANYQSAIINLVSMEREIKPLTLFQSTRDFGSALVSAANPMEYPGYRQWYSKFYEYVEKQKAKEPILGVLSHMLTLTGDISKTFTFSGPVTEPLFSGINSFIQSLGGSKKELREESQKMFLITASLAQWNHEKELIEKEWLTITTELELLQKQYEQVLAANMNMIGLNQSAFNQKFCKENDAHKRFSYLSDLKETCADFVVSEKTKSPKQWKEKIYFQMMDIQTLKVRVGTITSQMRANIERYHTIIIRYKTDAYIGSRIATLEPKLREMTDTFDRSFEPADYLASATRMYRVQ